MIKRWINVSLKTKGQEILLSHCGRHMEEKCLYSELHVDRILCICIYFLFSICSEANCEWKARVGLNQGFSPGDSTSFYRLFNSSGPQFSESMK